MHAALRKTRKKKEDNRQRYQRKGKEKVTKKRIPKYSKHLLADPYYSARPNLSRGEAEMIIEEIAAGQNQYLLTMLKKEQELERKRGQILRKINDPTEHRKLNRIFTLERQKAAEILQAIMREHETTLALKMEEFGLLDSDDEEGEDVKEHSRTSK